MLLECGRNNAGCTVTRYYYVSRNAFPHFDTMNVIYWDGHAGSVPNMPPYFFDTNTTANANAAKPYWDPQY
jgi:prepilin-type processing-associated H-X9-DG protein